MKIKVFLVDDHPLVRDGVAAIINQQPDIEVCGEAETAADALSSISTAKPDVVIVDISLANGSGLDLVKDIKAGQPGLRTLVLSMHDESLYAERSLHAGARGYIMKREAAKKVVEGIRAVHSGQLYVSDKVTNLMAEKFADGQTVGVSPLEKLSDRELEVFQLLGKGMGTRQIADHLHVGFKTVQAYCARIKDKLHLANATELLTEAIRWNEPKR